MINSATLFAIAVPDLLTDIMKSNFSRLALMFALWAGLTALATAKPQHGIAMHGDPALPPGFTAFGYVNQDAPKGGELTLAEYGSFDNLNPFIVRGQTPRGLREWVFDSLMRRNNDEPFSLYGLIAKSVEVPDDRSWVRFTIDPRAKFSDGHPITVEDVIFSLETLRDKGRPNHRSYYSKVTDIEQPAPDQVIFHFDTDLPDREMPLILGLMPILPKHWYAPRDFSETSLDIPVGSGPYQVAEVTPGRKILYRRNPDYWARDLAASRGQYNFDTIRIDYYRDTSAGFEAFKTGLASLHEERDPARWATGYNFPAARKGKVRKLALPHGRPSGLRGLVFNTRRPVFANPGVREALSYALDFEWLNTNYYYNAYQRIGGYFDNSALSAAGQPLPEAAAALLHPYAASLPEAIFAQGISPPVTDGSGRIRANLRKAKKILNGAGWAVEDGQLRNLADNRPMTFEILLVRPEDEKLALSFARNAKLLGAEISVRTVDSTQYEERLRNFDFDMIIYDWYASLSPGNEQLYYWGSAAADQPGTRNYPGIKSDAVDAMVGHLLDARDRDSFTIAAQALERALSAGHYAIPLNYLPVDWVGISQKLELPEKPPVYGYDINSWWQKPDN